MVKHMQCKCGTELNETEELWCCETCNRYMCQICAIKQDHTCSKCGNPLERHNEQICSLFEEESPEYVWY